MSNITITLDRKDWKKFAARINFIKKNGRYFCPFCRRMQSRDISWASERHHRPSCAFQKVELALESPKTKTGPKGPIPTGKKKLKKRNLQATEQQVLFEMSLHPDHPIWSRDEIWAQVDMSWGMFTNVLTRLVRDGYLTRPRRGFYSLRATNG